MAYDARSEEEKKKRREAFERNQEKLGLGAGNKPAGFMGAGQLATQARQQIPQQQPAQRSPQMAAQAAHQQRQQTMADQKQAEQQAKLQRQEQQKQAIASYQNDPLKARREMLAANERRQAAALKDKSRPTAGMVPPPSTAIKAASATPTANNPAPVTPKNTSIAKPASANISDKTIADQSKAGIGDYDDIGTIGSESVWKGNPDNKSFGLSVDNNAAVAQPQAPTMGGNSARGFGVAAAPRKAYGEDSRRQALAMDIRPYAKAGGRLTSGQIALKNSILTGDDEKYENQRYAAQLGAAQQIAQEGMQQGGANSRAQIGEFGANQRAEMSEQGANTRASNQLGFDTEKFQRLSEMDKRKLDMQQTNDDISNFAPKRLNKLYEQYDAAKTPEEQSEIAAQIQSLSGSNSDKEYWTSINGGERLIDPLTGATEKLPDTLLNRNTGEVRQQPKAERSPNDPELAAVQQSGKFTKKQKGEIYDIYMAGGDISGYLE